MRAAELCMDSLIDGRRIGLFRGAKNYDWELELGTQITVVCKIVHKFASVWCKTALGEVGLSLP